MQINLEEYVKKIRIGSNILWELPRQPNEIQLKRAIDMMEYLLPIFQSKLSTATAKPEAVQGIVSQETIHYAWLKPGELTFPTFNR